MQPQVFCVGICGATCSGKTSLSRKLKEEFPHSVVVSQDSFYHDEALLSKQSSGMINWDEPQSLNQKELLHTVQEACCQPVKLCLQCSGHARSDSVTHIIVVEGTMILALDELSDCLDVSFFLTLDETTCRQRREGRRYDGQIDLPGYFEAHVWPFYLKLSTSSCVRNSDGRLSLHELHSAIVTHIRTKIVHV